MRLGGEVEGIVDRKSSSRSKPAWSNGGVLLFLVGRMEEQHLPHGRKEHHQESSPAIGHHPDATTTPARRSMRPRQRSGDPWNEQTDRRSPTMISSPAKRGVFA